MSRLKRTFGAVVLAVAMALLLTTPAQAQPGPASPATDLWQQVWARLAAFWGEPVSRWLGGAAVEKIGSHIDPNGAQAPAPPAADNPGSDIGTHIDPNG
ncbi:MAG TPA: hypothetical protein VF173_06565 [Thermoanaerobaculia bacterium]|nr:hypothetical protein [Thermoanaerobaculia bacterium]